MSAGNDGEDRVNMVPMIDTMLFLILFFMLVTRFAPDEKAIASVLPTRTGGVIGVAPAMPPQPITIAVYPAGLERGFQPSDYARQVRAQEDGGTLGDAVWVRVGGDEPMEVRGAALGGSGAALERQLAALHAHVDRALAARDVAAAQRTDLAPVRIACYSGLEWKYALLAYDAVRAHEAAAGSVARDRGELLAVREVDFMPPRVRNSPHELGDELYEIVHQR
jgi:hypothetical protein